MICQMLHKITNSRIIFKTCINLHLTFKVIEGAFCNYLYPLRFVDEMMFVLPKLEPVGGAAGLSEIFKVKIMTRPLVFHCKV